LNGEKFCELGQLVPDSTQGYFDGRTALDCEDLRACDGVPIVRCIASEFYEFACMGHAEGLVPPASVGCEKRTTPPRRGHLYGVSSSPVFNGRQYKVINQFPLPGLAEFIGQP
jgi:hypothetical protein